VKKSTELVIDRPERWAKQLASHVGNRAEVVSENAVSKITFGFGGTGTISTSETAVLLSAEADSEENLSRIQEILGSHLLRFAKLEGQLTLHWS
jgi:hypothetical protein